MVWNTQMSGLFQLWWNIIFCRLLLTRNKYSLLTISFLLTKPVDSFTEDFDQKAWHMKENKMKKKEKNSFAKHGCVNQYEMSFRF